MKVSTPLLIIASLLPPGFWNTGVFGQVECTAPGNLHGIRVDGELMAFSTSIHAVASTTVEANPGDRGRGGRFSREGDTLIMTGSLSGGVRRGDGPGGGGRGYGGPPAAGASYQASFKDVAPGKVDAGIQISSNTNVPMQGVFLALALPGADYAGGTAQLIAPTSAAGGPVSLAAAGSLDTNVYLRASAKGVRVVSPQRQMEIKFPTPVELVVQDVGTNGNRNIEISFPLSLGNLTNGQTVHAAFTIQATGKVDKSPAQLAIDLSRPGRKFDGMGGNFRIQSPADAAQIQYNLDHLRVAWGRVAMPLDRWQPDENTDPVGVAATNALNDNVRESMEMAQQLARKNVPMIISVWAAPKWALATNSGGRWGSARINPKKWDKVCQCIGSYLEYLDKNYGAEPALFSFNESDMGVNVLQSPQEHADAIQRLGACFESRGLKTRMLLGDTGNPSWRPVH